MCTLTASRSGRLYGPSLIALIRRCLTSDGDTRSSVTNVRVTLTRCVVSGIEAKSGVLFRCCRHSAAGRRVRQVLRLTVARVEVGDRACLGDGGQAERRRVQGADAELALAPLHRAQRVTRDLVRGVDR